MAQMHVQIIQSTSSFLPELLKDLDCVNDAKNHLYEPEKTEMSFMPTFPLGRHPVTGLIASPKQIYRTEVVAPRGRLGEPMCTGIGCLLGLVT